MTHPVDLHVGRRLHSIRTWRGVTQHALAIAAGVSPQQIQKYENGQTRISASRLFQLADNLNIDVSEFFRGLSKPSASEKNAAAQLSPTTPQGLEVVCAFETILDENTRKYLLGIITALASEQAAHDAERTPISPRQTPGLLYAQNGRTE